MCTLLIIVKAHTSENDAWIIISGGVYNVTKFLKLHPGENCSHLKIVTQQLILNRWKRRDAQSSRKGRD